MELVDDFAFSRLRVRKYRATNGLKVILLHDGEAPVIAYQTWFAVGSRHERPGKTGIAHLFEHLMFNQTKSLAPGEFDRKLEAAGGETNAATWVDWTYYRDNLPKNELELAFRLESDRMANLVLEEPQVASEREVVMNERRFRVEDDVDGFLSEELYKIAFEKHPYHWPTIGWMSDIKALSTDDCRSFYKTYYAPNNATLVLVGDFAEAEALQLVDKYYGGLSSQPIPNEKLAVEPEQQKERRQSYEKPVSSDKVRIGYKSPSMNHADYAPLEVLCEMLFGGKSARLYRQLVVDMQIVSSVGGSLSPFAYPGLFEIGFSMQKPHRSEEAEKVIDRELAAVGAGKVEESSLQIAKTRLETRFWRGLRAQGGKGESLGHYEVVAGDFRKMFSVPDEYRAVTLDDVVRVAETYLRPERRTVILGVPDGSVSDDEGDEDDGDDE